MTHQSDRRLGSQKRPASIRMLTSLCIPERFNIHGDLTRYKCDLCPAEFKENSEFKFHMKMHRNGIDR